MRLFALAPAAALVLAACSPSTPPAEPKSAPAAATSALTVPAGEYQLDPYHSSLSFQVNHLGFSNYVARFTKFDATLKLDPANAAASSISSTIDASSVRTDFPGDYKASHKDSPFNSWDEDLSRSPKFLNASQHPQVTFTSTSVAPAGGGKYRIVGNLALLGQTLPVTLEATLVGSGVHPWSKKHVVGFSATGSFNRSAFGMNHLLQPLLVSDAVTIQFNGEFHQVTAPPS